MKKIKRLIQRWRYRRLYNRLFWYYAQKSNSAAMACKEAEIAFLYLTGYDWLNYLSDADSSASER